MSLMSDDEIVREFLVESHDGLDTLEREFLALEANPQDDARIAAVFRVFHSIKGSSGVLGFARLEALSHAAENLLARLRDREITLTPALTSTLLAAADANRQLLTMIERTGSDEGLDHTAMIEALTFAAAPSSAKAETGPKPAATQGATPRADAAPPTPPESGPALAGPIVSSADETRSNATDTTVRVDVVLLDRIMNLVGELVLTRNQLLQFSAQSRDAGLQTATQRLSHLTTELQEGVMKTRMQPIGNVWARYPRLIRDLAVACGKQVRLDMDGQSTELDRTVLEAVKDPLTHVLRNAIDHGLESPEERERAGKDPYGHLQLRAYHEGGQVNIEVIDDGRGIDAEKVLARAIERNLVTREKAKSLSEREVLSLIFLPGFSTADRVTSVSGRGVGMDVVKTNIERIGGYVDIQSQKGAGTTIRLKIPLTLAIIPALVVTSRGQKFAIPQVSLLELVRLEATESSQVVEEIHGTPVYRLRGRLLPLVRLHNVLELGGRAADAADAAEGAESYIVVLQADDCSFGLVVDNVHDTEEIVVKPLGPELKALTTYAGATIRGDGRVALILDVLGIASKAGVVASRDKAAQDKARQSERADEDHTSTLLVTTPGGARLAIPLDSVARLDELPRKLVESAGKKRVVQYRSELLPLVFLSEALGEARERSADADGPLQVVVYAYRGRRIGLVVGTIVDIVNEKLAIDRALREPGLLGAAVLQGKVTGVVDIDAIAQRAGVEPALADCAA